MTTCKMVTKDVLTDPILIHIDESNLNLKDARLIADQKAAEIAPDPMLMGWYEKSSGRFSPNVECCSEEKPGWIVYAESRGARITIDVNDEDYVFLYRDAEI